ncbi:chemotaxis protein CheW [Vibrio sp. T187]|uniref:chemotaxis protein CheW n=1 Tax=Vibrio TaxID=662 RepID=UPI0010CA10EF|nr:MULTISPECIES: chemotaxis protein CheW [Vibrio]MBW3694742.1 chemotaxis protein CheW [Vibrio sp. T187]
MNDLSSSEVAPLSNSVNGCLLVDIGGEIFGISIRSVKEVIELEDVTQVPMCTSTVSGVINVRGSVVPVIDAAKRLGLRNTNSYDKYSCIVLYDCIDESTHEAITIGVLVNRVRAIEELSGEELAGAPYFGAHIPVSFILHMARVNEQVFIVLDMASMLSITSINEEIVDYQKELFKNILS